MEVPKLIIGNNGGIIMDGFPLRPPFFSIWDRWPHLRGRSIVIGFIGGRGSLKTTSAIRTLILDYKLRGREVWSKRLPIAVDLVTSKGVTPLRSIESATPDFKFSKCFNGVLFDDEINEDEGGDSYRSTTSAALEMSYDIQELRKGADGGLSKMDFMWTTQSETMIPPRLRGQTDIIIKCADLSLSNKKVGMGEYSRWEIYDYSGILTGSQETRKMKETPVIFGKPWWHCFKTGTKKREEIRAQKEEEEQRLLKVTAEIADFVCRGDECGVEKAVLWRKWGIDDNRTQATIGKLLVKHHDITANYNGKKYKFNEELAGV